MKFRKSFLGFKPREVMSAFEQLNSEYQQKITFLQAEVENARRELAQLDAEAKQLRQKLREYEEQKEIISEILINAHRKAQQIENEAQEKARLILENVNSQIKAKEQELNTLKNKVEKFKEEFKEILEKYRYSLEELNIFTEEKASNIVILKEQKMSISS